ncbi:unnamed protein product [Amoebophrya sp. A25]|nr:unnamed protein product [Amoebophrya sp. A25]|eukprot:GSA25T00002826001.1
MLQKGNNATSGGPGGMGGGMFNGKKGSGGMNGYSGTQKGPRPGRNPHPNHPGKIFVGNLPTDITKEVLRQVFSTYGVVTDVHVMVGKSDSGQACAFVEYQQQIEAQTAINTLNNNYEIREGCGKIVCRFYEKPDSGRPGGLKGETSSTFHSGSTYKGGYGQGSQTTSYYGQGGKKGSGKGRYSSDHSSGYGNRYRQEDSYSKDKNNNLNAEPQKSPMIQQQHAAFLSASPNKDKPNGPQESANLSTPQNDERADRGFRKTSPAQKVATKSTTGSPGEEGASTESPSQVALVA